MKLTKKRMNDLFTFILERHSIYERRAKGQGKPWTKDKILQSYRFCNVYRELDTQTMWFAEHWRRDNKDLWFASLVFRFVNWSETAEELGFPVPWNAERFIRILENRKKAGLQVYSGAYMISTHGVKMEKHKYLADSLTKIWNNRDKIRYKSGETLDEFHARLMNCFDVGSFIAAQVIADCKYVGPMKKAKDWFSFAASGPGSKRGLNRVFNLEPDVAIDEILWRKRLALLHVAIEELAHMAKLYPIHAQDLQNCLCEFDKYERVRLGEGRPKSKYNGEAE